MKVSTKLISCSVLQFVPYPDLKQAVDNLTSSLEEAHVTLQDVNASLLEVKSSLEESQTVLQEKEEQLYLVQEELGERTVQLHTASERVNTKKGFGAWFNMGERTMVQR